MIIILTRRYGKDNDLNAFHDYGSLSLHTTWEQDRNGVYKAKRRIVYLNGRKPGVKPRRLTREQAAECLKNFFVRSKGKREMIP